MKNLCIRVFSSGLLAASLGVGLAHAASSSITGTGPHSNNQIISRNRSSVDETTTTTVNAPSYNNQNAQSGQAVVSGNTFGGNATSGNAVNVNSQSTSVRSDFVTTGRMNGSGNSGWNSNWIGNNAPDNGGVGIQNPVHNNFPVKSNTNLHNFNPWMAVGEAQFSRRGRDNTKGFNAGRFPVVLTASHRSQRFRVFENRGPRPCPVISFRTIRPPCQVTVSPCHQQHCHPLRHRHHHMVRHCVHQHQNHRVC